MNPICKQCGQREVEDARVCYATPVCFACLPPPTPLNTPWSLSAVWMADMADALEHVRHEDGGPKLLTPDVLLGLVNELREDRDHWKLRTCVACMARQRGMVVESEDAREWCWRVRGSEECQGPYATREEAIHDARHGWEEAGPIEVGRCTPPMDAIGTPDADHMRELVNDILRDEGLDAHAIILNEPAADAALREWFLRYVDVDGMLWIARDEETVWPDDVEGAVLAQLPEVKP